MLMMCCVYCIFFGFIFFFKQKTAYEMRISDWSSDVCSSDLLVYVASRTRWESDSALRCDHYHRDDRLIDTTGASFRLTALRDGGVMPEIGRASCRERVCQYV